MPTAAQTPDHSELNADRALVALLREICRRRRIELTSFSDDWVLLLRKGGRFTYVIGYDFALNTATAKMICRDKSATSDLLGHHGIPRIEHRIFHGAQMKGYVPQEGNWRAMLAYFEACGRDVVCKPNEGTGGKAVSRARSEPELEAAVDEIFAHYRSLSLSPFERIAGEYRVAILQGEAGFVYRKDRAWIEADGRRTVGELLAGRLAAAKNPAAEIKALAERIEEGEDWPRVPAAGEKVLLNWRHNLGQGAAPQLLDPAAADVRPIVELARRTAEALTVAVASVDIAVTAAGPKVLEVNSGIMMENLARNFPGGREIAYGFYDRIVAALLGDVE